MAVTLHNSRDIKLDVLRVQGYRHFCNKIWQACRFTLIQLGKDYKPDTYFKLNGDESALDNWILSRLAYAIEQVETNIIEYKFHQATTAIYNFWLYDFCDIYIEATKPVFYDNNAAAIIAARNILFLCIDTALRLLAPFMPFITEELWQRIPKRSSNKAISIHVSEFPEIVDFSFRNEKLENPISFAIEVIKKVRSKRSELQLLPIFKREIFIVSSDIDEYELLKEATPQFIATLAYSSNAKLLKSDDARNYPF